MTTQLTPASAVQVPVRSGSPCIGVCEALPDAYEEWICRGCFRSKAEVAAWGVATAREKEQIDLNAAKRARKLVIGT